MQEAPGPMSVPGLGESLVTCRMPTQKGAPVVGNISYADSVIDESFPSSLESVREFAAISAGICEEVAYFGLATANFTQLYREPGIESMDAIDAEIGSKTDVESPLLAAHRLAKFYVISAGDALLSCCELVRKDYPMHIGSAALARTAAEHASKAMYIADPDIGWKARVLRMRNLFEASHREYKSSNDSGATQLIENWKKWHSRTRSMFRDVAKQPSTNSNRGLIEQYFKHALAYEELSRPTHGNATWLTLAVIQEQKGTNYTWCATLRNFRFAMDVCIVASDRLCGLWGLDRNEVLSRLDSQYSLPATKWADLNEACDWVRAGVDHLSDNVTVDFTEDPQPRR